MRRRPLDQPPAGPNAGGRSITPQAIASGPAGRGLSPPAAGRRLLGVGKIVMALRGWYRVPHDDSSERAYAVRSMCTSRLLARGAASDLQMMKVSPR
jgi:hypothetical protein